jgi:hypothetical protein
MPTHPPEPVFNALKSAAVRSGIPLTLLMAVAKVESDFNPKAVGPMTAAGWKAQGLMQLSPSTAARFGVSDPFDATQNALGGATLLAELSLATNNSMRRMLAAYVWGATRSESVPQPAAYPVDVERYIKKVTGIRSYYENLADPKGATASERLGNAIVGLNELNPGWKPAAMLAAKWDEAVKFGKIKTLPDIEIAGLLADFWREYSTIYPIAAITDARTPAPWRLNPDVWPKIADFLDDKKRMVINVVADAENYAKDLGGDFAIGAGGAAVIAGLLWLAVSSKRRGRA